ncbi:MAG TPA: copper chaperone PCu(A)C [Jatrophihabitantaceae bacterium]|nr:copper chaperone PCu(A)C [Jatrophihabitantaceae bacterium]
MKLPAVAGVLLVALGVAGLVRGAVAQTAGDVSGNTGADPIVVANAFVRPPVPPATQAAAYFTVYNTTDQPDTLTSVASGAGATTVLHVLVNGVMTAVTGGFQIPAHGSLVLSVGKGHVMISDLYGKLTAGQTVNLELTFQNAGPITVAAPVVPFGAPTPGSPTTGATK